MIQSSPIAVVGGGAWGTALAIHLAGLGHPVNLWVREGDLAEWMRRHRENPVYLPGARIPSAVTIRDRLAEAVESVEGVLVVVPTQFSREVLTELRGSLSDRAAVVLANKGIEEQTLALPLEVTAEVLGDRERTAVLSGPSFAPELARGRPTTVVAASSNPGFARWVQTTVSGGSLRVYTNDDPVGVQVAGALKNVMAIAAGVVHGMDMGHNAIAALVTRGLAELTRLGVALGGRPATFSGLAGLGDLVLTCTGELSRNRRVGEGLARGERLQDVLSHSRSVAEGVRTTRSARALALGAGVDMPIVEEVHRLLFEGGSPKEAVARLMSRPLKSEVLDSAAGSA